METVASSQLFLDRLIHALSWTLFHSLWLGLILAACAGAIMLATRNAASKIRYKLLAGTMLVFAIGVVVSFGIELNATYLKELAETGVADNSVSTNLISQQNLTTPMKESPGFLNRFIDFLNANSGYIVFIWMLFIGFRGLQLGGGIYHLNRIKKRSLYPIDEYWEVRLSDLKEQLGINKTVRIFQSGIAKVPAVIGHFKPMILFPVGMVNSLSVEEVEAILIHELAHIKRLDYLTNMVQIVMETLFFFNPSFLWVSSLLHAERENCCDDIALEIASNKRSYINALVSFQEFQLGAPLGSMAFTNKKDQLLHRVKRILYNHNKTLNVMEKLSLVTGLIITGLIAFSFSSKSALPPIETITQSLFSCDTVAPIKNKLAEQEKEKSTKHIVKPSKNFTGTIITTVDKKNFRLEVENDVVKNMTVNNEEIPAEKFGEYKATTDKIIADSKASMRRSEEEMIESEKAMAASHNKMKQAQEEMEKAAKEMEIAEREMEIAQKRLELNKFSQELYESGSGSREAELEAAEAKRELKRTQKDAKSSMKKYKKDLKAYSYYFPSEAEAAQIRKEVERARVYTQAEGESARARRELERSLVQGRNNLAFLEENRIALERKGEALQRGRAYVDGQQLAFANGFAGTYQLRELEALNGELHGNKFKVYGFSGGNKSLSERIINDLLEEHIITDPSEVTIKLNAKSLTVNGKKQPKEVFEMFKEKYVKGKNWTFEYKNRQD